MVNELDCGGRELGVVLEDSAVARVRVDGEFRASDPTVHVFGEGGGTMRSLSPFAINVGWVITDRSAGGGLAP
jgi:hypothetical protein